METTQLPTNNNYNITFTTTADIIYKSVGIGTYKSQGNKTNGRMLLIIDEETGTEIDLVINSLAQTKVIIDCAIQHGYGIVDNRLVLNQDMVGNIAGFDPCRKGFKGIEAYTLNMVDVFANYAAWKAGA